MLTVLWPDDLHSETAKNANYKKDPSLNNEREPKEYVECNEYH